MFALLLSGLSLGLLSSFHCAGMCGPLQMALPLQGLSDGRRIFAGISYHLARLAVYTLSGLLFGTLGHSFYLAGWQRELSIVIGGGILVFTFLHSTKLSSVTNPISRLVYRFWTIRIPGKFFFMGMANGLLPCGMVYFALAAALSTGNTGKACLFMLFFGLGTLPLLLLVSYYGRFLSQTFRARIRKAVPFFLAGMGILLILRGLNLGIPFISPLLPTATGAAIGCH